MIVELLVVLIALWIGARYGSLALGALAIVLCISLLKMAGIEILPQFMEDGKPERLSMNIVIQIIMITATAFMIIFCKAKPKDAVGGKVWQNGMVAVVAIYGIAWMSNTYFDNYKPEMQAMLTGIITKYPWSIAFAFFTVSVLINSQGAVVVSMLPLAYSLHIEPWILLGVMPSVYGYFFIPNYPSDIVTATIVGLGVSYVYHFWLGIY